MQKKNTKINYFAVIPIVNKFGIPADNVSEFVKIKNKKIIGNAISVDITGMDRIAIDLLVYEIGDVL
jgi:hypothetical protein